MHELNLRANLVTVGRILITTVIILSIYLTNFFHTQYRLAATFYWVLIVFLLLNLPLLLLNKLPERHHTIVIVTHLVIDFTLVNFIVLSTGGSDATFALLYIFVIMYSSLFLGFAGVIVVTVTACVSFFLINFLFIFVFNTSTSLTLSLKSLILATEVNILGFALVGILTGFLADRLRKTRRRIIQQSDRIQELKDYNEYIFASLHSGLLTTDTHFGIVKINDMGQHILGLTATDIIDRDARRLFKFQEAEIENTFHSSRDQGAFRQEKWLELPGGGLIYLGLSISPLMIRESTPAGYIITFQNLTDIKKLQDEMAIQKKMVAIGNLSAAIAHEIRNPLASMMGSIQVLKNQLSLSDAQSHLMDIILRESHRLDRIITNFLQFASTRKFSPRPFDIQNLIRETILLFTNSPEIRDAHRVELAMECGEAPFYGDPDQIKQVIWNLCTNAIKAMPTGGNLHIRCTDKESSYIIEFRDEGKGMNREEIQQLFEPFQSRFPGGLGLGMAIVYRIVSDHNGRIEVDSAPEEGSTFRLILPVGRQIITEEANQG